MGSAHGLSKQESLLTTFRGADASLLIWQIAAASKFLSELSWGRFLQPSQPIPSVSSHAERIRKH